MTDHPTSALVGGAELESLTEAARGYLRDSRARATQRAYRSDWACFTRWCETRGVASLPASPETVALYLSDLAGVKAVATIARRATSIAVAHRTARLESPTRSEEVRLVLAGIRRTFGVAARKKAPARVPELRRLVATLDPAHPGGVRDRALLSLGFAMAARRSELVALDVADVEETADGLMVNIARSKTDQEGEGVRVGVPFGSDPAVCPVRSLRAWLTLAEITEGPIFRPVNRHGRIGPGRLSGRAVAEVVKRCAAAAGLDPSRYAGHSLRSGMITSAIEGGASEHRTMQHSRHRSLAVFRGYVRDLNLLDGSNPLVAAGL
jgi:site-specific recombinase XerD